MPLIEKQLARKLQLKNCVNTISYGWRIQLLIWIMFNGSCVYPKWWWFEDFCGTGKRISEDEKSHIISQLMSTGMQMHGHKCMCWLGKKYTCPNYETPWWIRIILWHFGGTMYNFFPTRSPKMRGIVWCNLKKWYKPLATCGCRFERILKLLVFQEQ